MPGFPRNRRVRLWTCALAVAAVTIVGLIAARRHAVATRWAEAIASADALQARLEHHSPARLRQRPAGSTAPNDAWDAYAIAAASLEAVPADDAAALAALHRAGDAPTARFPMPWRQGLAGDLPAAVGLLRLGEISAAEVDAAVTARDPERALAQLGDGFQLAVDLLGANVALHEMVGMNVLGAHHTAATALAQTLDPASAEAERLAALLGAVDTAIPVASDSIRVEGALVVRSMGQMHDLFPLSLGLWRYAFSAEIAVAVHVRDCLALATEVDALLASGAPTDHALDAFQARQIASRNPITRLCAQNLDRMLGERLAALSRLRMLRIALAECRGAPALTLPCPQGGAFRTEREAGVVRVHAPSGESLELRATLGR